MRRFFVVPTRYPKRQTKNPTLTNRMPTSDAHSQLGTDSSRINRPAAISASPMVLAVRLLPFPPPEKQNLLNEIASPEYRMRRTRALFADARRFA